MQGPFVSMVFHKNTCKFKECNNEVESLYGWSRFLYNMLRHTCTILVLYSLCPFKVLALSFLRQNVVPFSFASDFAYNGTTWCVFPCQHEAKIHNVYTKVHTSQNYKRRNWEVGKVTPYPPDEMIFFCII